MSPRVRDILEEVAQTHDCRVKDITGPDRRKAFARARFEAMWRIRRLRTANGQRYSLGAIAEIFGQRDHTTILHGIRRWEAINNIVDTDNLHIERKHLLESVSRLQAALDNATTRVSEIDRILSTSTGPSLSVEAA